MAFDLKYYMSILTDKGLSKFLEESLPYLACNSDKSVKIVKKELRRRKLKKL